MKKRRSKMEENECKKLKNKCVTNENRKCKMFNE